jgi:hypothetical protein
LLLVTPLSERAIIAGQRRALQDLFLGPIILVELLFISLWFIYNSRGAKFDEGIFSIMIFGNMFVLLTDFLALGWVGMWTGLHARFHHRAVLLTLLRILVLPWLLYFLLGVAGFFQTNSIIPFFVIWYGLGAINDLVWAGLARQRLRSEFRLLAAGAVVKAPKVALVAAMEYPNP